MQNQLYLVFTCTEELINFYENESKNQMQFIIYNLAGRRQHRLYIHLQKRLFCNN